MTDKPKPEPDYLSELTIAARPRKLETLRRVPAKKKQTPSSVMVGRSKHFFLLIKGPNKESSVREKRDPDINEKIMRMAKKGRRPFVSMMEKNMKEIRKILLTVLAPKLVPVLSALDETRDILKEITGSQMNTDMHMQFVLKKQLNQAAEVKIASWVSAYLELTAEEQRRFYERLVQDKNAEGNVSAMRKLHEVPRPEEGVNRLLLREIRSLRSGLKQERN